MLYLWLADAVVITHFAFVIFVVAGGLLVWRWRWVLWLHLPALFWGALVEFTHWICPLTDLENWLRSRAGVGAYQADFLEHYLLPILYPAHLTPEIQIFLGILVIAINVGIYGWLLVRSRRKSVPPRVS
ncbi:MAG: DUF2784 domain-containing protein [Gammaproteobacteria bacterium]